MALPCESKLEYTFTDTHGDGRKTGTGPTEDAAAANALSNFGPSAEADAKKRAIDDAKANFSCEGPCSPDVTPGTAAFKKTNVAPPATAGDSYRVEVSIQVPMTVTCRKRQLAGLIAEPRPYLGDFASLLPPAEDLPEDDMSGVIAYLSIARRTAFVKAGRVKESLQALGAAKKAGGLKVKGLDGVFKLVETRGNPQIFACGGEEGEAEQSEPTEGARRVKENYKCGPRRPGQQGKCKRLREGLYGKIDVPVLAWCRFATNHTCVEYYVETARVKFYADPDCAKLIAEYKTLGWSCVALF